MNPFIYLLPKALSRKKLSKALSAQAPYKIMVEQDENQQARLLDTFDAKLRQSAHMLFQQGDMLFLLDLHTGSLLQQAAPEKWSFAADVSAGAVAAKLLQFSSLRAFLPVAELELALVRGLFLDDEGKTRARLHHLNLHRGSKSVAIGSTEYLRGYGKAHRDLCRSLTKTGACSCDSPGQLYEALGIMQQVYTSKPVVELDPDAPVKTSAHTIITVFLQTARANEQGVLADHDTEFLHDYRVSLRKIRSVLSLFRGVYGLEQTTQLKKDFAAIMQQTNTLRDLDVYLLNKLSYFGMVPVDTHEGLAVLFDYLLQQRKKEHISVGKVLRSKTYRQEIGRLEKLFSDPSKLSTGPQAQEKSLPFACRLIFKRYDKVCKIARDIDSQTEDSAIHQLRINCKKLRYLMEFFAPLFPEEQMQTLVKALKLLQDNLGNFNDYSVQQTFLRHILSDKMTDFGTATLQLAESVGALTAILYRLQQKERRQVMKNFVRFDSEDTRAMFIQIFHTQQSKEHVDENNSLL